MYVLASASAFRKQAVKYWIAPYYGGLYAPFDA